MNNKQTKLNHMRTYLPYVRKPVEGGNLYFNRKYEVIYVETGTEVTRPTQAYDFGQNPPDAEWYYTDLTQPISNKVTLKKLNALVTDLESRLA